MRITPIMLALSTLLAFSVTAKADPVADKITNYNTVKNRTVKTRIDLATLSAGGVRGATSTNPVTQLSQVNSGVLTVGSSGGTNNSPLSPVLSTAQLTAAQLAKFENLGYTSLPTGTPLVQAADAYGPARKSYSDAQTTAVLGAQWDVASIYSTLTNSHPTTAQWDAQPLTSTVFGSLETNAATAALLNTSVPTSLTTTAAGLRFQALTNDLAAVQQMVNDIYAKYAADYYQNVLTTTGTDGSVQFKTADGQQQYELMLKKTKALLGEIYNTRTQELVAQYQEDLITLRTANNPKFADTSGTAQY